MSENTTEKPQAMKSAVDWEEVMNNRYPGTPGLPGLKSEADWEEVMNNRGVTEVTTMTLPNKAEPHTEKTDEEILKNARRRAPRLNYLLSLAMADINAEKY